MDIARGVPRQAVKHHCSEVSLSGSRASRSIAANVSERTLDMMGLQGEGNTYMGDSVAV